MPNPNSRQHQALATWKRFLSSAARLQSSPAQNAAAKEAGFSRNRICSGESSSTLQIDVHTHRAPGQHLQPSMREGFEASSASSVAASSVIASKISPWIKQISRLFTFRHNPTNRCSPFLADTRITFAHFVPTLSKRQCHFCIKNAIYFPTLE